MGHSCSSTLHQFKRRYLLRKPRNVSQTTSSEGLDTGYRIFLAGWKPCCCNCMPYDACLNSCGLCTMCQQTVLILIITFASIIERSDDSEAECWRGPQH